MAEEAIYQILNIKTNKRYIGSTNNISKRIQTHKRLLKKNIHPNRYLQFSYNLHGQESFIYSIIKKCNKEDLIKTEQEYINIYKKENLYNLSLIAGKIEMNDYIKNKISKSNKGKKRNNEQRVFLSLIRKGKKKPKGFALGKKNSMFGNGHRVSGNNNGMAKHFVLYSPCGIRHDVIGELKKFCFSQNLSYRMISKSLLGLRCNIYKGWYCCG